MAIVRKFQLDVVMWKDDLEILHAISNLRRDTDAKF